MYAAGALARLAQLNEVAWQDEQIAELCKVIGDGIKQGVDKFGTVSLEAGLATGHAPCQAVCSARELMCVVLPANKAWGKRVCHHSTIQTRRLLCTQCCARSNGRASKPAVPWAALSMLICAAHDNLVSHL